MRTFLCAFTGFSVAIPMRSVSSLLLYTDKAARAVEYNTENNNTYISLPLILQCPAAVIRHGMILKNSDDNTSNDDDTITNKTILLSTEVECETEILPEKIYPLPRVFGVFSFSAFFSGIVFNSQDAPILLLNPNQLILNIQKEFFNHD